MGGDLSEAMDLTIRNRNKFLFFVYSVRFKETNMASDEKTSPKLLID
jgi:hypothetical protein